MRVRKRESSSEVQIPAFFRNMYKFIRFYPPPLKHQNTKEILPTHKGVLTREKIWKKSELSLDWSACRLQCIAVCCSVLQCGVVCCSVLQCVAVCCSVLQCVAVCCSVLQCVAVCCSVLQCVAVCCSVLQSVYSVLQCVAVRSIRVRTRRHHYFCVWTQATCIYIYVYVYICVCINIHTHTHIYI